MCMALAITSALAAPTTTTNTNKFSSLRTQNTKALTSSIIAKANILQSPLIYSPASNSRLRKRHSKRHSIESPHNDLNENSTILEWVNPCGGYYDPNAIVNKRLRKKKQKKIYNELKWTTIYEFKVLNSSQQFIDISKFQMWGLHEARYKFLPKLKPNLTRIPLKRWYRNMQTYVASFAYLHRVQLNWDRSKQSSGEIAGELENLFINSRSMLCELETALNKTHPFKHHRLPQVTREQMNKQMKLRTRMFALQKPNDYHEADAIDLKFVKYYYYEFLENMWSALRNFTKRLGQKKLKQNPKEYNEIDKQQNGRNSTTTINGNSKKRRKEAKNRNNKNQRKT